MLSMCRKLWLLMMRLLIVFPGDYGDGSCDFEISCYKTKIKEATAHAASSEAVNKLVEWTTKMS